MKFNTLKVTDIEARDNIRAGPVDVDDLVESISKVGLLHPLGVNKDHKLIYGFRRLKALKKLEWKEVPVVIFQVPTESSAEEIAELEFLARLPILQ